MIHTVMAEWQHHLTYILLTLFMGEMGQVTQGQRLPTRDEKHFQFQISHAEIFYDTKLLPDGAEVSSYIFHNELNRYFFMVEEDNTAVSLTITPCTSELSWQVSLHDLPHERSGDGYRDNEDELMEQWTSAQPTIQSGVVLKTYNGSDAASFVEEFSPAGIYMLGVTAMDSDTSLRLFATSTPDSDHPYPERPSDASITVKDVSKRSVTLSWKPSPTESQLGQPVEYCIFANKEQNFKSQCAANAFMYGEAPPTAPPNSGFGFAWEDREKDKLKQRFSVSKGADPNEFHYECIGDKTSYMFGDATPGQLYFFDVFVINTANNMSTAYLGTKAKTKEHVKYINLKDGKISKAFMKRTEGHKVFKLEVKTKKKELLVAVQSCAGQIRVKIYRKRRLLEELDVTSLQTISIHKPRPGTYHIRVEPNRRRSTAVKVYASTDPSANPYPELPGDSQIKVFENLSTCNSLTVAWLGTNSTQQYCLYRQASPSTPSWTDRQLDTCLTSRSRKKRDKVVCRNFRNRGRRRSVMTETIRGLKPDMVYVLDVHTRRIGGERLSYQQTWAKTKETC